MPEDKTVYTKNIDIHWKFNIIDHHGNYSVFNQQNRSFQYPLIEVTSEDLKNYLT